MPRACHVAGTVRLLRRRDDDIGLDRASPVTDGCAAPSLTAPNREDCPTPVMQGCATGAKGQLAMSRPWAVSAQMMAMQMAITMIDHTG